MPIGATPRPRWASHFAGHPRENGRRAKMKLKGQRLRNAAHRCASPSATDTSGNLIRPTPIRTGPAKVAQPMGLRPRESSIAGPDTRRLRMSRALSVLRPPAPANRRPYQRWVDKRRRSSSKKPDHRPPAAWLIFSSAWSMVKLAAFWRGGKSLNVARKGWITVVPSRIWGAWLSVQS
jgi:hypothetical protein